MRTRLVVALALVAALLAMAAPVARAQLAPDDALRARLARLETELRCLVCQNQTLAESNAPLAEDLRREIRGLADAGKSDAEIRDFLVARYGDFVLYRPPVKPITWLLWFGPFALLAIGAFAWWRVGRGRMGAAGGEGAHVDAEALERARDALR